jgi:hypothetical protein
MSLPRHLEEAAERQEQAQFQIRDARAALPTLASLQSWLGALTEYCEAASDIQRLTNESIHEKLHAIAGRLGMDDVL